MFQGGVRNMHLLRNHKGQSLVEFAIILPLILLIVMGIAQFGLLFNSYLTVQNATREGARTGVVGGTNNEIRQSILTTSPFLKEENLTIHITPQDNRRTGETLTVQIIYNFPLQIPIINNIFGKTVQLNAQTSMRIE